MILTPELLLYGYSQGMFPMAETRDGPINWYRPEARGIIPLNGLHISHTLLKTLRSGVFSVTYNRCFSEVISRCSDRSETWISHDIESGYTQLHNLGYAHSVEVWNADGELSGGLYGVSLMGAFFGESMFHSRRDASKVALVYLAHHLASRGFTLLDTQYTTPHLISMGAVQVTGAEYETLLLQAMKTNALFTDRGITTATMNLDG